MRIEKNMHRSKQTRRQRPSPASHAADYVGRTMIGQDGKWWYSHPERKCWVRVSDKLLKESTHDTVKQIMREQDKLGVQFNFKGDILGKKGGLKTTVLREATQGTAVEGYWYSVEQAVTGRSACKFCGEKITKDEWCIKRSSCNPWSACEGPDFSRRFHIDHMFSAMLKGRCTSKVILSTNDVEGLGKAPASVKQKISACIQKFKKMWQDKCSK